MLILQKQKLNDKVIFLNFVSNSMNLKDGKTQLKYSLKQLNIIDVKIKRLKMRIREHLKLSLFYSLNS